MDTKHGSRDNVRSCLGVSVGYTMDTMYFGSLETPIDINPDLQLPQFSLVDKVFIDCSQNYTTGTPQVLPKYSRPGNRYFLSTRVL